MPGKDCDVYCFYGGIDKDSSVLGYNAVSTDRSLTTFRREIFASFLRVKEVHSPKIILSFFVL